MTWTAPRTWTNGDVATGTMLNTHLRDNLLELRTFHGARMYVAGALSTANTTFQSVTYDSTDYDTNGFVVLASDWFVVPSGYAGTYRVGGITTFGAGNGGARQLRIQKNETYTTRVPNGVGTTLVTGPSSWNTGPTAITGLLLDWQGPLAVGDHVTIETWQSFGGALALTPGIDTLAAELEFLGA